MHLGKRLPDRAALLRTRTADANSLKEGDDRSRPAGHLAKRLAVAAPDRQRAADAAARKMLHQSEKKRQVSLCNPLLVKRQNVVAGLGAEQEVGVLDALG